MHDVGQLTTIKQYEILVSLLDQILHELRILREDVDALDRYNRPYGDGARLPRRRAS